MAIPPVRVRFDGNTAALDRSLAGVNKRLGGLGGVVRSLSGAFAALGAGLSIGLIGRKIVTATIAQQNAVAQLNAALASTGAVAGKSSEELQKMASSLQRVTTFGDEATIAGQAMLLSFTNIRGDTFDRATKATLDLATAMGTDLKSASIQVGKALNDPIRGVTALQRVGITFSDAQRDVIRSLQETGDTAGAQAVILKELETQFGGSAEAARNTLGGALKALSNAWGDLFEASSESSAGIVSAIDAITDVLPEARRKMDEFFRGIQLGGARAAVAMGELELAWKKLRDPNNRIAARIVDPLQLFWRPDPKGVAEAEANLARLRVAYDDVAEGIFNRPGNTGAGGFAGAGSAAAAAAAAAEAAELARAKAADARKAELDRQAKVAAEIMEAAGKRAVAFVQLANRVLGGLRHTSLVPGVDSLIPGINERKRERDANPFLKMGGVTAQAAPGTGDFTAGVSNFKDAVDGFGRGVSDAFKGFGKLLDPKMIGSNIAGGLLSSFAGSVIGMAGEALKEGLGGIFDRVSRVQERLANALERNTRALQATGDFLGARLQEAGLSGTASLVEQALQEALNRFAVGDASVIGGVQHLGGTFGEELERLGVSIAEMAAVAELLGIDLTTYNEETLNAFLQQLGNATSGLEGMSSALASATRNMPSWFRVQRATFAAAPLLAPGGAASSQARATTVNAPTTIHVHQQPGENGEALARRVTDGLKRMWAAGVTTEFDVRFAPAR
jgi:hypothetical protein